MKKIKIDFLNPDSIQSAIDEVKALEKKYVERTPIFMERLAEAITKLAQSGFNGAIVSDLVDGKAVVYLTEQAS